MRALKTMLLILAWGLALLFLIPLGILLALLIVCLIIWDLAWSRFETALERESRHKDSWYGRVF